ncbi:MAG: preprotein translocase subunit SecY [Verrucomicrobiales bacterium]
MISAFSNTWKIPELRDRILFTLAMVVIVRLGVFIPLPGIDTHIIDLFVEKLSTADGTESGGAQLGVLMNVFSGGGLTQMGIFALGIMPYISASIMMQLLTAVVPKLSKLSKEDGGRQKINQYTRFVTIAIALVQGFLLAKSLQSPENLPFLNGIGEVIREHGELVPNYGTGFVLMTVLTIVSGTMFLMWIGDQITDRGIGNGTSLIISVNIISSVPSVMVQAWDTFVVNSDGNPYKVLILVFLFVFLIFVIAATISITQAQRRIAVQYARRVAGRREMSGGTQYLPLKINYAGVMPIIFATAILSLPPTVLGQIFPNASWVITVREILYPDTIWFYLISGTMIFFFSYFWVATMFNPSEIAENLKKGGGYVPGVRPGKPTSDFLDFTMTRLTFAGSIFLTLIFMLPFFVALALGLPPYSLITSFFGGTSLLILVGVLLDMMRQVETHLLQRNYDGFLRKGKIKGRSSRRMQQGAAANHSSNGVIYLWTVLALVVIIAIVAFMVKG